MHEARVTRVVEASVITTTAGRREVTRKEVGKASVAAALTAAVSMAVVVDIDSTR